MDGIGDRGDLLLRLMSASTLRARVLSDNIANQNVPGYKRRIVRFGQQHHDIAMFKGPETQTLHHYALRLENFDHLKQAADRLVTVGIDKHVRSWEKPSDHVPVWADLDLETQN